MVCDECERSSIDVRMELFQGVNDGIGFFFGRDEIGNLRFGEAFGEEHDGTFNARVFIFLRQDGADGVRGSVGCEGVGFIFVWEG